MRAPLASLTLSLALTLAFSSVLRAQEGGEGAGEEGSEGPDRPGIKADVLP